MSLRRVERELRAALAGAGRGELAERALERVRFTDDGSTIYVHLYARPDWPAVRPGDVFVLAHADYPDLRTLADWRALLEEARLSAQDHLGTIVRWLTGR